MRVLPVRAVFVVLRVPAHKVLQALVQADGGIVSQVSLGRRNVGVRERDVAGFRHRDVVSLGGLTERLFERRHEVAHRHRFGVS